MLGGDCRNRLYQTLYNLLRMLKEIAVIKNWLTDLKNFNAMVWDINHELLFHLPA